MLCSPMVARRCVRSFEGGVIVFAPHESGASFPMAPGAVSKHEVAKLTVFKYFVLVFWTFTGLCTLLGLTDTLRAADSKLAPVGSGSPLDPSPAILSYVERRAGAPVTLVRRFEYRFKLCWLRVVMLHFRSEQADGASRLHLVETCRWSPPLPQWSWRWPPWRGDGKKS